MGVAKHVLTLDSLCGARMGVAKCVLTLDSLCGARMSNTPPFWEKLLINENSNARNDIISFCLNNLTHYGR